jgi:hypothetical protein
MRPRTRWPIKDFLLVFFTFLLLYLPFLSIDLDANGVIEAANLNPGSPISRNHIIYGVVGKTLYRALQLLGFHGRSVDALQLLNAICGALGVALAFFAFQKLGATRRAALLASVLWGTSFIYWLYSTDIGYVSLAGLFVVAALLCRTELSGRESIPLALLLGLLFSLATLTFQMAVFMAPILLWPRRGRIRETILSIATAGLIIGGTYLALGISAGHTNAADLLGWAGGYAGGRLPEWGRFDIARLPIAIESAMRSFQSDLFERLRDFVEHPYRYYVWRLGAGAVCFVAFSVVTLVLSIRLCIAGNRKFMWMIAGYLVFWPFIVWFSPSEAYWFLVPNLFLCAAIALTWGTWTAQPVRYLLVWGVVLVMAASTFISTELPNHVDPGIAGREVDCIARYAQPRDVLIATDWTWPAKLNYYHGIHSLQVIDLATSFHDRDKLFATISEELQKTRQRGGSIYIIEPASYKAQHLAWLAEQTGFTIDDFDRYPGKVRFQCEDSKFREVTSFE